VATAKCDSGFVKRGIKKTRLEGRRMQLEEAYAILDREIPTMEGWCSPEKARRMASLVVEQKARKVVELGVFGGRSLVALGLGLAVLGADGCADGVDPYAASASLEGKNDKANDDWWGKIDYGYIEMRARQAIKACDVERFTALIKARSLDADLLRLYAPASVDVIHVDSNHSEEVSCAEIAAWSDKIASGGLWIADDVDWPTMVKAQGLIQQVGFELVEHHRSWAVFRKTGAHGG
jgi:predicted O-methyltransferase YrrM